MADSSNNVVTLVGTLGADPEVRRTSAGKDVISFSLVTNERIRGTDGRWTDGAASWFKVTAWDYLGRHAGMSFRKGQRVIVRGTMKVETWQARDGSTGTSARSASPSSALRSCPPKQATSRAATRPATTSTSSGAVAASPVTRPPCPTGPDQNSHTGRAASCPDCRSTRSRRPTASRPA